MKKELLSIITFFGLVIFLLTNSFSVKAERIGLKNLFYSGKAKYSRFAPAPFKGGSGNKSSSAIFGNALNFDGENDYVTMGEGLTLPQSGWTEELWIYVPTVSAAIRKEGMMVIGGGDELGTWSKRGPFFMVFDYVTLQGGYGYGTGYYTQITYTSSNVLTVNAWNHIAQTYDGSRLKAYVNGVQVADVEASEVPNANPIEYLGRGLSGYYYNFKGTMDELRIWSRARTADEIKENYAKTVDPNHPDLLLYYSFDQGTGGGDNTRIGSVTDSKGKFDGALNNFALTGTNSNFVSSLDFWAPTGSKATNVTKNSFIANWTMPPPGGAGAVNNYILEVAKDDKFTNLVPGYENKNVPGNQTFWEVSGLSPGVAYYYRVKLVVDGFVGRYSGFQQVETLPAGFGNALNFTGKETVSFYYDDKIEFYNEGWTQEMWIYLKPKTHWSSDHRTLVSTHSVGGDYPTGRGPSMYTYEGTMLHGGYGDANGANGYWNNYDIENVLKQGEWTHIAQTFDGATLRVYVNGDFLKSIYLPGAKSGFTNAITAINVGKTKQHGTYALGFEGNIDEVRIWNYPRSGREISENYKVPVDPNSVGLVVYYDFNQGIAGGDNRAIKFVNDKKGNQGKLLDFALNGASSNFVGSLVSVESPKAVEPTSLTVTIGSFTASWAAPASTTVNNYILEVAKDDKFTNLLPGYANKEVPGNQTFFEVSGLSPDVTYYYRVRAVVGKSVSPNSNIIPVKTTALSGFGNALNFDGEDDYVTMGAGLTLPHTGWTEEMWVYVPVLSSNTHTNLISGEDTLDWSKRGPFFQIKNNNDLHGGYGYGTGDEQKIYDATNVLTVNAWNHIAQTYDGSRLKAYVNGVQMADVEASEVPNANPIKYLGRAIVESHYYFKGSMDEVRIWSRARTADEIKENYAKTVDPNHADLLAYYNFNQGTGGGDNMRIGSVTDSKGKFDGIPHNFALNGTNSNFVGPLVLLEAPKAVESTSLTVTIGSFTASWVAPASTAVNNYILEVAKDDKFTNLLPGYANKEVPGNQTFFEVSGLSPDVTYYYRVRAVVGKSVSPNSNIIPVKTLALTGMGNALNFDGSNDFVTIREGFTLPQTGWTEEMWIYVPTVSADIRKMGMMAIGDVDIPDWSKRGPFFMVFDNVTLRGGYGTGDNQITYDARNVLTVNAWNHIAQTYDGSRLKAYVNGTLAVDVEAKRLPNANPIKYLGKGLVEYFYNFKGSMDEVRIWSRARTADEIKENYAKTVDPNHADLLAYYNFNQGTGGGDNTRIGSVTDSKGKFDGIPHNFALNGASSNFVGSLVSVESPKAVEPTNLIGGSFTARWIAPASTAVNNYILEVAKDDKFTNLLPGYENKEAPGNQTFFEVSGLSPDVTYYYRVKAVAGESVSPNSNIIPVTTTALSGFGNALNFSGKERLTISNDGISFPANEWTEEMWIFVSSTPETSVSWKILLANANQVENPALRGPCVYVFDKTKLHGGYGDGKNWKNYITKEALQMNAWNHVAQTFDGAIMKVYVNGSFVESFNLPGTSNKYKINYIGNSQKGGPEGFVGNIDEVRFWSRVRTAEEIRENYTKTVDPNDPDLLAYYDFNQGVAGGDNRAINALIDNKGAYHATLNNFAKTNAKSNFTGTLKLTAPVAGYASEVTLGSFTAHWAMGEGSSPTANTYFIDVSTDETFADESKFVTGYRNKEVGNVAELTVTGLNPSTAYYYRVRAGYSAPWLHLSDNSNTITVNTGVLPAITAVDATNITEGSFTAGWQAPIGKVKNYILEVARDDKFTKKVFGYENKEVPGSQTSWLVSGLSPDFTYYYRIVAVYKEGVSVNSNVIQVKTLALTENFGNALTFDGTDYVSFGEGFILPQTGWTEEMWIYLPSLPYEFEFRGMTVIGGDGMQVLSNSAPFLQIIKGNHLRGGYGTGAIQKNFYVSNVLTVDAWNHIAQTYNGRQLKAYVNGIQVADVAAPERPNAAPVKYLGLGLRSYYYDFKGSMDEVRIWKRARSAEEIRDNYTKTVAFNDPDLLVYYDFNQGVAGGDNRAINALIDKKGIYHATPINFNKIGVTSNFTGTLKLSAPVANPATGITGNSFTARWAEGEGSSPTANTYFIDVSTDATFADESKFVPGYRNKEVGNVTEFTVTGLNMATAYYYRLRANYAEPWLHPSANSNAIKVNTLPPNTIALAATDVKVYGDAPYRLAVSSSGTGSYAYMVAAGDAVSINNIGQVSVLKAGTATIVVTQSADAVYTSAASVTQTITVSPKELTVTFKAIDKEYDGAAAASGTFSVEGLIERETVEVTSSDIGFSDKNVGKDKAVTARNFKLSDANYKAINTSATSKASIKAKPVTVTFRAANKPFDGTAAAKGELIIEGKLSGDDLTAEAGKILFAEAAVGRDKPVTATGLGLKGADRGNYRLTGTTAVSTADITQKGVTVTFKAIDKEYDGAVSGSGTFSVEGFTEGETVEIISSDISFLDKNVGKNKEVKATNFKLSDVNYSVINATAVSTANITAKPVTATFRAANKPFDGTAAAVGELIIEDKLSGDDLTAEADKILFDDANTGRDKPVTATGIDLKGADRGNYRLTGTTAVSTADITQKGVTVTFKAIDKEYDGAASGSGTLIVEGFTEGETVEIISSDISFLDKNVGKNKEVRATNFKLSDVNYSVINATAVSTANITAKPVTATFRAANKPFDGTAAAKGELIIEDKLSGDDLTAEADKILFDDANAGRDKPVTATGIDLKGADRGNYRLTGTTAVSTADITQKGVRITFKAIDKEYDGAASGSGTFSVEGFTEGETVEIISSDISFLDKNVGKNKEVKATNFKLSDVNYSVINATAVSTANITAKPVTATFRAANKPFDGTAVAIGELIIEDKLSGDDLTAEADKILFDDANAGRDKPVTATGIGLKGTDKDNYRLTGTTAVSTADITQKGVTVTFKAIDKEYDGAASGSGTLIVEGLTEGETVEIISSDISFLDKNVGKNKEVRATNFKLSDVNYSVINATAVSTANITAKPVTATFRAANKPFDGTAAAKGELIIEDKLSGDDLTAEADKILFEDANAGRDKPVTATGISLKGTDRGNYRLTGTTAVSTADITQKGVRITFKAIDKEYDGAVSGSGTFNVEGLIEGETVEATSEDIRFLDKNVGKNKEVKATNFKLSDVNYSAINATAVSTANITAKPVTAILRAANKPFDRTAVAIGELIIEGKISGDKVFAEAGKILFAEAAVGRDKPVTATGIGLKGTDKDNYRLMGTTAVSTADITQKGVTVTFKAIDKEYDGVAAASGTFIVEGFTEGETVEIISSDISFLDKNVGKNKEVRSTNFKLSDVNYSVINAMAVSTANITAKPVTATFRAANKPFDGTAAAKGELIIEGKVLGDDLTAEADKILFAEAAVGRDKPVTATDIGLKGADRGNYRLTGTTAVSTADITQKGVTVTFKAIDKEYDGVAAASGTFSIEGLTKGESVEATSLDISFADKNVGKNKTVTVRGFMLSDANYRVINATAVSTANITAKPVTVILRSANKSFDGNAKAKGELIIEEKILGDEVFAEAGKILFDNANAGRDKPVTATGIGLKGTDRGNYRLTGTTAVSTADITQKEVTVVFKAIDKIYDGTAIASGTFNVEGLAEGETVKATSEDISFSDKNVGKNKAVTARNFTLSSANYKAINVTAASSATITAKPVRVTLSTTDKVYDGTAAAIGELIIEGKISGDKVFAESGKILFADANAGRDKLAKAAGIGLKGADRGNYRLTGTTAVSTATIATKPVTVTFKAIDKEYDGAAAASGTFNVEGLIEGETIQATSSDISFSDKNVGEDKAVTARNFTLSSANYRAINAMAVSTATIAIKPVRVTLSAMDKVYDGAVAAPGGLTVEGLIMGDDLTAEASNISFADANAGEDKPVTAIDITLKGTDKNNYELMSNTAVSTADINRKGVTVSINRVLDKVYDGNKEAMATFKIEDLSEWESVSIISADVSFSDKNAGEDKSVNATNFKLSDANYSVINLSAASMGNIMPKELIITADNKTRLPEEDNPLLTAVYSGFVDGEDNTNALTVQPLITTTAANASPPGNYPIAVSGAVAANNNYRIIYNKGNLTISTVAVTALTFSANILYTNCPEGILAGTFAGTLTAASTHPKAIYAYSLVSGEVDNDKFTIKGDKLYANTVLNYAEKSVFTVKVQVSTQWGDKLTKEFSVPLLYVNGSPTLDAIPHQSVCATADDSQIINLNGITPGSETDQTTFLSISSDREDMFNALSVAPLAGGKGIISYSLKAGVSGSAVVTVTVKDNGGTANGGVDTYSVSFTVNANALPAISISTSDGKLKVIRGRTLELTATAPEAIEYSWVDAKGIISGRNSAKLTVQPTENTTYTVKATTAAGCVEVKQVVIEVGREYSDVIAGNIITPNGDGVNDLWLIENIERYPNATVKVFNRAGRLVFSQIGYDNKWNGYFNGKPLHEGVYYYVIDFGAGLYKAKGYVTILN